MAGPLSDEDFTRMFRQLDDASHIDALEVLSVWEARANGGSAHAQRRMKSCQDVLGVQERRIYR